MLEKYPADVAVFDIDCTQLLPAGVTIVGTPTMSFEPSNLNGANALTFGTPTVNAVVASYPDGRTAAIGKVIQCRIGGGTAKSEKDRRRYAVLSVFQTSDGQTMTAKALLDVLPIHP